MTRMLVAVALTWVLVWSLGTAWAHPLAPLGLTLRESEDGQAGHLIVATLKQPRVQQRGGHFAVRLAPACRVESTTTHDALESVTTITHHRCAVPLAELSAAIDGLSQADVDAVVTFVAHDGDKTQILLADDADHATLGGFESTSSWRRPVAAGFEHLWGGLDHVLLLVGLVLLERRWRPLLLSLTAFTVGHALSLGATVAGWIAPATRWTEVAIAATLLWLAFRLVARNASSPKREGPGDEDGRAWWRRPEPALFAVGLIHGLGFAAVLSSAGLAGAELWAHVAAFHAGLELAQLGVVCAVLVLVRLVRIDARWPAYAMGSVAVMWIIERAAS